MNRKEALKILGFNPSDDPSKREITKAYRKLALQYHLDKHPDVIKNMQKQNEEKFKQLSAAYEFFTREDAKEAIVLHDEDLDKVSSSEDLKFCLYAALFNQNIAFLKKLFSKFKSSKDEKFGDYINEMHFEGFLPLDFIEILNCSEIAELLLKHGADPNVRRYGEFPLHRASSGGYDDIVELLLKHGADPDVQDQGGDVPLYTALIHDHYSIVELLLKHGANPDAQDKRGESLLHIACFKGYDDIVELLLKHGANLNVQDRNGNFLLYEVLWRCSDNIVKLLLEHGADPNIQNECGEFLLHKACSQRRDNIVKLLLENGADPNVQDQEGKSLLHYAIYNYHGIARYKAVKLLLDKGVDPNIQDDQGKASLHYLCENDYLGSSVKIAKLLLRRGANPDLKDKIDRKPADCAKPGSDVGKLLGTIDYDKAFLLGIAALFATSIVLVYLGVIMSINMVQTSYFAFAAALATVALCCACCAVKILFFSAGPSSEFTEARAEFLNSQSPNPAGAA